MNVFQSVLFICTPISVALYTLAAVACSDITLPDTAPIPTPRPWQCGTADTVPCVNPDREA